VPDRGGQGEHALATRVITPAGVRPPWRSRDSWDFLVLMIDSMRWRIAARLL
jgi:hypothetical protein